MNRDSNLRQAFESRPHNPATMSLKEVTKQLKVMSITIAQIKNEPQIHACESYEDDVHYNYDDNDDLEIYADVEYSQCHNSSWPVLDNTSGDWSPRAAFFLANLKISCMHHPNLYCEIIALRGKLILCKLQMFACSESRLTHFNYWYQANCCRYCCNSSHMILHEDFTCKYMPLKAPLVSCSKRCSVALNMSCSLISCKNIFRQMSTHDKGNWCL